MAEWAARIPGLLFQEQKTKADFDQFMEEVQNENVEYMSFRGKFDSRKEMKPTYEQLSQDMIADEASNNIQILKGLETLLQERLQSANLFFATQAKYRPAFEIFQHCNGTLKQALDALFVFLEQEFQQARQQHLLGELRKALTDVKIDVQRRHQEYQREVAAVEKEVYAAEKKLAKSKDQLERSIEIKQRLESFDSEAMMSPRMPRYGRDNRELRLKEADDVIVKLQREVQDDVTSLLRALSRRDQVLGASRKAFQKLDRECKKTVSNTLKRMVERERESAAAREATLVKLEQTISMVDIDADMEDFINERKSMDEYLELSSQALSILGDLKAQEGNQLPPQPHEIARSPAAAAAATATAVPIPSGSVRSSSGSIINAAGIPFTAGLPIAEVLASAIGLITPDYGKPAEEDVSVESVHEHLTRIFYCDSPQGPDGAVLSSVTMEDGWSPMKTDPLAAHAQAQAQEGDASKAPVRRRRDSFPSTPTNDPLPRPTAAESAVVGAVPGSVDESVRWLSHIVRTQRGRDTFITELNQFRSHKVDVGSGFGALGAVLWLLLDYCREANDVHSAKVIMMLSQTFYRVDPGRRKRQLEAAAAAAATGASSSSQVAVVPNQPNALQKVDSAAGSANSSSHLRNSIDNEDDDDHNGERPSDRSTGDREYLKELLSSHAIWHDGHFWEQALWQCAIEQLQSMTYDVPWHDLDREARAEAVRRVHEVIFSQVMAITHSMIELGCTKLQTREFLYRMCVIHQLSERHRHQLILHLNR